MGAACRLRGEDTDDGLYEDRAVDPDDDRCSTIGSVLSARNSGTGMLSVAPGHDASVYGPTHGAGTAAAMSLPAGAAGAGQPGQGQGQDGGLRVRFGDACSRLAHTLVSDDGSGGIMSRTPDEHHLDGQDHLALTLSPESTGGGSRPSRFRGTARPSPGPRPSDPASSVGELPEGDV